MELLVQPPIPPIPTPMPPAIEVPADVIALDNRWVDTRLEIACLMLVGMIPELQNNLEDFNANYMLKDLKTMFSQQAEQELL
ncbi:hypothetical protein Tco_1191764 [Tanacetum coccineum]